MAAVKAGAWGCVAPALVYLLTDRANTGSSLTLCWPHSCLRSGNPSCSSVSASTCLPCGEIFPPRGVLRGALDWGQEPPQRLRACPVSPVLLISTFSFLETSLF